MTATGHVFIATSLDGFIADPDGGIGWLTPYAEMGEDHGYAAFMASVDGLVMGRKTFETALGFGGWPFDKPVVVMSRTLAEVPRALQGRVRVSNAAPAGLMAQLGAEGWRRAYVDGGATIRAFLAAGLVRDMILSRVPVVLGRGLPLFGPEAAGIRLRHAGTTAFPSGLVQSRYEVV